MGKIQDPFHPFFSFLCANSSSPLCFCILFLLSSEHHHLLLPCSSRSPPITTFSIVLLLHLLPAVVTIAAFVAVPVAVDVDAVLLPSPPPAAPWATIADQEAPSSSSRHWCFLPPLPVLSVAVSSSPVSLGLHHSSSLFPVSNNSTTCVDQHHHRPSFLLLPCSVFAATLEGIQWSSALLISNSPSVEVG